MKTLKFDNYRVKIKTLKTHYNYNLSVQVFLAGNKTPEHGTIMKEGLNDKEILEWVFHCIDNPMDSI